jgi:colicin import membrane protein
MAAPPEPEIAEPAPIDVKPPEISIAADPPKPAPRRDDINALLNQLTRPEPAPRNARAAARAQEAVGAGNAATASLADALRNAIRGCWSPIPGAPNPADQIVTFSLQLNRDGTVARVEAQTLGGNSYTAAARLAAERAIHGCQPYNMLPASRYNEWRDFQLRFDPRQMLPQ